MQIFVTILQANAPLSNFKANYYAVFTRLNNIRSIISKPLVRLAWDFAQTVSNYSSSRTQIFNVLALIFFELHNKYLELFLYLCDYWTFYISPPILNKLIALSPARTTRQAYHIVEELFTFLLRFLLPVALRASPNIANLVTPVNRWAIVTKA